VVEHKLAGDDGDDCGIRAERAASYGYSEGSAPSTRKLGWVAARKRLDQNRCQSKKRPPKLGVRSRPQRRTLTQAVVNAPGSGRPRAKGEGVDGGNGRAAPCCCCCA
jgi:hypothetical protein